MFLHNQMKMCIKQPVYLLLVLFILTISCRQDNHRLTALQTFGDNVLEKGKDRWSSKSSPLLADGINLQNQKPLEYTYDGEIGVRGEGGDPNRWIMHNLANQQN